MIDWLIDHGYTCFFLTQMTGYMFKNAEYKLSMQQALGVEDQEVPGQFRLKGKEGDSDDASVDPLQGKIRGKLRVRYKRKNEKEQGNDNSNDNDNDSSAAAAASSPEIEVDAAAYVSDLRSEVSKLRDELSITRKEKEEALRKDLLLYIRTLPEQELRELTNTMSPDVLVAMKGLVGAVIAGVGEGQIGPDTVTEQSGEAMAQLCMWQLAIGYNLRTLEVREEMKKSLTGSSTPAGSSSSTGASSSGLPDPDDEGGVDFSEPNILE